MDKFAQQRKPESNIRKYSDECDYQNCKRETHLVITVVRDPSGYEKAGAFSQFGNTFTNQLRDGYSFVRFITRCAEHYQEDLERKQSGALL